MSDLYAEWEMLCTQHEAARDAYLQSFLPVNKKFSQIFQGISNTNPSDEELSKLEVAWNTWEDVRKRMEEFVKAHV
jgi:hypothetical protein